MIAVIAFSLEDLLSGKVPWYVNCLLLFLTAVIGSIVWYRFSEKLQQQFFERNQYIKYAAISAAHGPVLFYIWFLTAINCLDFGSGQLLSKKLHDAFQLMFRLSGVAIFSLFLWKLKAHCTSTLLKRSQKNEVAIAQGTVQGISKVASIGIAIIGALLLMEVTGINLNTLIAFGGVSGLAIAIASQDIIANFFGGIMILINQPFAVGDSITLPGPNVEGYVDEIGWYETRMHTKDKRPIYIPNSLFSKAFVINTTRRTHYRINEKIAIGKADVSKAQNIVRAIKTFLSSLPVVDTKQKLLVNIVELSSTGAEIGVFCLIRHVEEAAFLPIREQVLMQIAKLIQEQGAEITSTSESNLPGGS